MIVIGEDIWDQIETSITFVDIDDRQYATDSKRVKIIRNLRKDCVILKPDKGNGVVVIKKDDYINAVQSIFAVTKFNRITTDPTLVRRSAIQRFINTMYNRGKMSKQEKEEMRPKSATIGRAHDLPKTHKQFDSIPKFRPIIDTSNTPYYGVGRFLS